MSDLNQALGVFFNTVVFEGLKTVQQTVEHLVPAVVEHLTTGIVPVKPTGSQSTLITFVVRASRADDDSDFVPGRIRNAER